MARDVSPPDGVERGGVDGSADCASDAVLHRGRAVHGFPSTAIYVMHYAAVLSGLALLIVATAYLLALGVFYFGI